MAIQQERGEKGEQLAATYLKENRFEIVHRNYRAGKSEIDLICKEGKTLVFVEVKTRTSTKYGHPEDFVNSAKATKVIEGAEAYMVEHKWEGAVRFDIVSVLLDNNQVEIRHFKDAFY
ncbi:MAG: YraN family protein [Cyclobacteriaceae bacterium]|nr:YraN family protein [Cyclobacteriaceae bacterium]